MLQAIGLPAVRIASGTANVLDFNELFPSLINTSALPNRRHWFVEGVVRNFSPAARDQWETAFSNRNPIQIHVRLNPPELERNRIRSALHREVAQQFLGAAFGFKLVADKISSLDENLGKEASDLAELLSQATQALHKVINPPRGNDKGD